MLKACAQIGERRIPYFVRVSRRARRLGLCVRPDTGVVVTAPVHAEGSAVEAFLRQHQRWLVRQLDRFASVAASMPRRWPYGETLPYRGEELRVIVRADRGRRVLMSDGCLEAALPNPTVEAARRALKRWYVQEAQRWCMEAVIRWAPALDVGWRAVGIGTQRSRWGSCSATGRLRLNYRLVMAPPHILDYVVVHELAHRKEMNHSQRFWTIVAQFTLEHRAARRWLTTYGPYLGV
jgi:predicted metal-dependent hydrolase